jgi:hypothetical protein
VRRAQIKYYSALPQTVSAKDTFIVSIISLLEIVYNTRSYIYLTMLSFGAWAP